MVVRTRLPDVHRIQSTSGVDCRHPGIVKKDYGNDQQRDWDAQTRRGRSSISNPGRVNLSRWLSLRRELRDKAGRRCGQYRLLDCTQGGFTGPKHPVYIAEPQVQAVTAASDSRYCGGHRDCVDEVLSPPGTAQPPPSGTRHANAAASGDPKPKPAPLDGSPSAKSMTVCDHPSHDRRHPSTAHLGTAPLPASPRLGAITRTHPRSSTIAGRCLRHCLGHRDVPFEAKRFRHRAVATHQVAVCDLVASSTGQQGAQRQQRDVA